jgi:hypothetical protein
MNIKAIAGILIILLFSGSFCFPDYSLAGSNALAQEHSMYRTNPENLRQLKAPDSIAPLKIKFFRFAFAYLLLPDFYMGDWGIDRNSWEDFRKYGGRGIDVILDYDDYVHITRTYETDD